MLFLRRNVLFKVLPQRWMSHLLVVADSGKSEQIIEQLNSSIKRNSVIVGAVLIGDDACRSDVSGIPVVCSLENASPFICREWIDEVIICTERLDEKVQKLIENCHEMEVPVYVCGISKTANDMHRLVEIGEDNSAATDLLYNESFIKSFGKRCLDVAGGLLGSLLALIIMTVLGPIIQRESPGPILYKQERIGKNGRHFNMLKIRTMHMNADAQKQDLMDKNQIKDGMMFKLDFDPRIIGNETLPDGSKKTGIGEFFRKTSLDEFPQFFNVLMGDMSLVGTRPPTVDEWEKYEFHHRARLSCKPGITGLWQVSGRSNITDFEEVVKLDMQYIHNRSLRLDIKILLKTVRLLFGDKDAM